MKLHEKLAVVAACLVAARLLFSFLRANSAAEPPPQGDQGAASQIAPEIRAGLITRQPTAFRLLRAPDLNPPPRPLTKRRKNAASDRFLDEPLFRLHTWHGEEWMHLAVVACGDRLEETMTMLKSVVLFSLSKIKIHIFAEDFLQPQFKKSMILKDVDSLLYVDTDVLFLRPVDDIWYFLNLFNSTQLAAMAPEHEIPRIGWYSRFARHPYYGAAGVNSGVMLMNLTRIRNQLFKNSMIPTGLRWEELLYPLYHKYKNDITWGDQDLLNIIFHYNPEYLYVFPCQWNYRPDHCMYGSNCRGAEDQGVSILHGNRGVYHDDKQPAFKVVYEAVRDFPFEENLFQALYFPLQNNFLKTVHTLCGRLPQVFLKQIEQTMRKEYEHRVIQRG
ncbi:glucoside xylosyltransferase 2 isoform X2 [Scyliorhinus canicula]|uniref:glucoside xylosyltransferase 2 isoform X2 n=1 Tax=Scyliorhinus canicula TaxID=7830 RepID=UPI0018F42533|nr:glucoside xylosyltransferase 2 isoform X2 [Scyliorhinus canicula]